MSFSEINHWVWIVGIATKAIETLLSFVIRKQKKLNYRFQTIIALPFSDFLYRFFSVIPLLSGFTFELKKFVQPIFVVCCVSDKCSSDFEYPPRMRISDEEKLTAADDRNFLTYAKLIIFQKGGLNRRAFHLL